MTQHLHNLITELELMHTCCSYIESCHADFFLFAATVAVLGQTPPAHQLPVGPPVILLLLVDGRLVLAPLEVVRLFAL